MRILIAEDSATTAALVASFFSKSGAEVVSVSNGCACVDQVINSIKEAKPFDMIILDICMPQMSGNEAAGKIRAAGYKGKLVAITATASVKGKKQSSEAGFDTYLNKQVVNQDLINALVSTLPK